MKKLKRAVNKRIVYMVVVLVFLFIVLIPTTNFRFSLPSEENQTVEEELSVSEEPDEYADIRKEMVETQMRSRDITDEGVLVVMESVPRHKFITDFLDQAYEDHPLPIGYSQTISQPYIVALMTQSLEPKSSDKVLEIGTGSGYQAAVLAELVDKVYTIEIIGALANISAKTLADLGYDNVEAKHADGYFGWEENSPFDAIIVTAAANHVPLPLIEQLKDGGKLVIPLASTTGFQTLTLITKKGTELETVFITGVRFVPMTGKAQKSQSN
ncbi:MAG: protein-L-isoaspartate(D-aspartate) O-methyltransferase [Candidatus Aenigmarchaeota archaeon]